MVIGLFLAYGAAVTSLGLALATWVRRLDFAVALTVAVLGTVTVGWLVLVAATVPEPATIKLGAGSPIIGITGPTIVMNVVSQREWIRVGLAWVVWIIVYFTGAAVAAVATVVTFDRCLGRVTERQQ